MTWLGWIAALVSHILMRRRFRWDEISVEKAWSRDMLTRLFERWRSLGSVWAKLLQTNRPDEVRLHSGRASGPSSCRLTSRTGWGRPAHCLIQEDRTRWHQGQLIYQGNRRGQCLQ